MQPEQLRIAIAKACGARIKRQSMKGFKRGTMGEKWVWRDGTPCAHPGGGCYGWGWNSEASVNELPNYARSLDAMHDAENALTKEEAGSYAQFLGNAMGMMDVGYFPGQPNFSISEWEMLIRATASQRAEAFLRAKGLWSNVPALAQPDAAHKI